MDGDKKLLELWTDLSPEAQDFVGKVITLEKAKLHMSNPQGINNELLSAIEEVVR